jgi:hypothetical protein
MRAWLNVGEAAEYAGVCKHTRRPTQMPGCTASRSRAKGAPQDPHVSRVDPVPWR